MKSLITFVMMFSTSLTPQDDWTKAAWTKSGWHDIEDTKAFLIALPIVDIVNFSIIEYEEWIIELIPYHLDKSPKEFIKTMEIIRKKDIKKYNLIIEMLQTTPEGFDTRKTLTNVVYTPINCKAKQDVIKSLLKDIETGSCNYL